MEYQSLIDFMFKHRRSVDKAKGLLDHWIDIKTLLTLVGIIPMLHQINILMKHA